MVFLPLPGSTRTRPSCSNLLRAELMVCLLMPEMLQISLCRAWLP